MIFLSHSSKDKFFVEYIANKIGKDRCIYDTFSFESGEKNIDEMIKNIEKSKLFVIFISENSLESKYVLFELEKAKKDLNNDKLKKIFPIIIDENIKYSDERIPEWLKEYNLKPIMSPKVAHRRIVSKILEINNNLISPKEIFIGRNKLIQEFEEITLNYGEKLPSVYIASGLEKIGRSSFLRECLEKIQLIDKNYQLPIIELDGHESLEDFIIKISDLGFAKNTTLVSKGLLNKSKEEKLEIVLDLVKIVNVYNERIFIKDKGAIVLPDGEIVDWFKEIRKKIDEQVTFLISSKFRVNNPQYFKPEIAVFSIPELSLSERKILLSHYLNSENINIERKDFETILHLLTGYPEQIKYAVAYIKEKGIQHMIDNTHLLIKYNADKVSLLMRKYEDDNGKKDFLILLSHFDYIGIDFLYEIIHDDNFTTKMLKELYDESIIEYIGVSKEYLRMNDVVKDYTSRLSLNIPKKFEKKLKIHIENFLNSYQTDEKDGADFFFSMKQALLTGENVDNKYLVPSHFLKTMIDLYNQKKDYNQVIELADRVLEKEQYLDKKILKEIRYYLCLALIRMRSEKSSERFLKEVGKIEDADKDFLMAFYYRIKGNPRKSIEILKKLLTKFSNSSKIKRELVQVFLNIEDYESAYELSKENYKNYPNNPYHIQAYLKCIIKKPKTDENKEIVEELLESLLDKKNSSTAKEMYIRGKAWYSAYYLENKEEAISLIDEAIEMYPNSIYSYLEKFDILYKFDELEEIDRFIEEFKNEYNTGEKHKKNLVLHMQVRINIKKKNKELAEYYLNQLKDYPEDLCKRLKDKINSMDKE